MAEIYGQLYHLLRQKGRSLSTVDIMLAGGDRGGETL
jgi:hypothetical protein